MRGNVVGEKGKQLVNTSKHKKEPSLRFSKIFCIGLVEINESIFSTLNRIRVHFCAKRAFETPFPFLLSSDLNFPLPE